VRGVTVALLLGGFSYAEAQPLSDRDVQAIMELTAPALGGLTTVCINGECTAAYECALPPSWNRISPTAIQVVTDCLGWEFVCSNGARATQPGDYCRYRTADGGTYTFTLRSYGFTIEGL
jgi:hypothetical protein